MNNGWIFNGNNGNLNNNNVNNGYQVQGAVNLSYGNIMTEAEMFSKQMELVFNVQKNKRRGHDSLVYENRIVSKTVKGTRARLERTLRIEHNYTFLVSIPSWREIMATEFEGRKIDHEICDKIIPMADKVLSPYTFNNRVGKGSQTAINQLIENIYEVTEGYTKPARIIKLDFSGYFPNALWDYAEKVLDDVIDKLDETEDEKSYLKWLTMIAIHCNPAAHCEYRTPKQLWYEHIKPEKSILTKPEGVGAAIGRLTWQTAMGLYINDVIIWLTEVCKLKVVCFVDDITIVVPEERHEEVLLIIPILREWLAKRNVRLNDRKFYDQPYQHGCEFLGSHIKPHRIHLNNRTYYRGVHMVREVNEKPYKDLDKMVQSFNSYGGLLKNRTDYNRLIALRDTLAPKWWDYLEWNEKKLSLAYKKGYSVNDRLERKYNLKLKHYEKSKITKRPLAAI